MDSHVGGNTSDLFGGIMGFLRKCLFHVLSFGPMPAHVAFIMDGNRRFTRVRSMKPGSGHRAGFLALMSVLQYCYEMGVKYVTIYAFSIDNFRRKPDEVEETMDLMLEKIESLLKEESLVTSYGVRVNFWGNLSLLREPIRLAAEKVMAATARNIGPVLSICVAYTSTDEIVHAVRESCREKLDAIGEGNLNDYEYDCEYDGGGNWTDQRGMISATDVEKHLYTAKCPEPDIVIRTSGETRLSNFLLWQTTFCHLQNPTVLWPEFSLRHLAWAILEYQRAQPYLAARKRRIGF